MNRVPSLLAMIAHPGDEVFNFGATLAHYAALGAFVNVACATRGEGGRAQGADLGATREAELRRSCAALGIAEPIFLGFRDSGTQNQPSHERSLSRADFREVESRICTVIRQVQPHIIVTFDPRGGNVHPDKRTVQQATAAAFQFTGHDEQPPQRLFFVARPLAFMRLLTVLPTGPWAGADPEHYATAEATIAARIDTRAQRSAVNAARRSHASQALGQIPDEVIGRVYGPALDEGTFALGGAHFALPRWPLYDLRSSSLTTSASHKALESSRCMPSGVASPDLSASCQLFLRSTGLRRACRYALTRCRCSERPKCPAMRLWRLSSSAVQVLSLEGVALERVMAQLTPA